METELPTTIQKEKPRDDLAKGCGASEQQGTSDEALEHDFSGRFTECKWIADPHDVITVVRDPVHVLGKRFEVGAGKKPNVQVAFGLACQYSVPSVDALAAVLGQVSEDPHAAIINAGFPGIPIGEEFAILSERQFAARLGLSGREEQIGIHELQHEGRTLKAVGRFKDNTIPSRWQILDRDVDAQTPAQFGDELDFAGWMAMVERLLPGVAAAPSLRTGSSSSRVMLNGVPVGRGNGHVWVQVADARDVERLREALKVRAAELGMTWLKLNKHGRAGALTTLFDLSVLVQGRLVFCGRPMAGDGMQVVAQRIDILASGTPVDTSGIVLPDSETVRRITREAGVEMTVRNGKRGSLAIDAYNLTLDTAIEMSNGRVVTVGDAIKLLGSDCDKLRCQTPFRSSESMAGVLRKSGQDGRPCLFDVGTGTTHWLCDADFRLLAADDFDVEEEMSHEEEAEQAAVRARNSARAERLAQEAIEKAKAPTLASILNVIELRDLIDISPAELVAVVIADVVRARLGSVEEETAIKSLKEATGYSVRALRTDLAAAKRRGPDGNVAQVSADWPLPTARALVDERFSRGDQVAIRRWQEEFLVWDGTRYQVVGNEDVRAAVYRLFQEHSVDLSGRGPVDNTVDALRALVNVPSTVTMPSWLEGTPPAPVTELVAVRNGLLHLPTRTLVAHDPRFFNSGSVDVVYSPSVPEPLLWLQFLEEAFPGDAESVEALQQWFGYLLTQDTTQQKGLICVGPKRCGKGTIARVLRALLGEHNCAGPTLGQLSQQFGLQGLIGKSLALISDARVAGSADLQSVSENLLRITGEDAISVPRKNLPDWVGKLTSRFVLLTNILPGIIDAGGAVASRFVVLKFTQSFYGREDTKLTGKLLSELPGILNWALDGLEKLRGCGAFLQPRSGLAAVSELIRTTTPILGFIEDMLSFDPDGWVPKDAAYQCYLHWCKAEGMRFELTKHKFFAELYANSDGRIAHYEPRALRGTGSGAAVRGVRITDAAWDRLQTLEANPSGVLSGGGGGG